MKTKPYPKYKPSGVEWLGNVPEHWGVKRLRNCLSLITNKNEASSDFQVALENIESWTGRYINSDTQFEGEGVQFEAGDILFGKLRPYLAKVYLADRKGESVGDIFVLRPQEGLRSEFVSKVLLSEKYIDIIDGSTYGSKMPRASWDFLGNLLLIVPPLPEQQAIADFLDRETGRIDALIAKKERLLELLAEQRAALISRAVTRGLDTSVKLKPSGVEWLGDIPGHWEVKRVKHIANIRYGVGEPPEYVEDGVAFIRATNINAGMIESENLVRINPEDIPFTRRTWLKTGDIIVVRSGAYTGDSAIIPEEYSGSIAGFDMVVSCRKTASSFLAYALLSKYLRDGQIFLQKMRAAQPHLNAEELGNCLVFLPPLTEQHAIADFLDRETTKIEALSGKVKEAIKKLREYRSALISAAVTGKSCVKEVL